MDCPEQRETKNARDTLPQDATLQQSIGVEGKKARRCQVFPLLLISLAAELRWERELACSDAVWKLSRGQNPLRDFTFLAAGDNRSSQARVVGLGQLHSLLDLARCHWKVWSGLGWGESCPTWRGGNRQAPVEFTPRQPLWDKKKTPKNWKENPKRKRLCPGCLSSIARNQEPNQVDRQRELCPRQNPRS